MSNTSSEEQFSNAKGKSPERRFTERRTLRNFEFRVQSFSGKLPVNELPDRAKASRSLFPLKSKRVMFPERLFLERSRFWSLGSWITPIGSSPVNRLPKRFKYLNLESRDNSDGIVPDSVLFAKFKISRNRSSPSEEGISPSRLLFDAAKSSSSSQLAISCGMIPEKLLACKWRDCKRFNLPISDGIVPLNWQ
ncbi:hypothetical protein HanRHA438_Chr00c75g0862681 [Helianthus annuus]|nr:hypothetical protein HanIR_Chr09g0442701 [Helianthus annuus]KAJ0953457.1 hypothetical protein HanRHA438_Chr00c75g0862681 [Helianthus annuus]